MKRVFVILISLTLCVTIRSQTTPDHTFYNEAKRTTIPFELFKNQIFVPMQVNGSRPLWFILDTGANTAAVDEALAKRLGLMPEGEAATQGVGSHDVAMKFLKNIKFSLPGLDFVDEKVITLDYRPNFAFQGRETEGVFSYDFLKRFVVTIDYAHRLLSVAEPDTALSAVPKEGEVFPLTFQHGLPFVEAEVTVPGNAPQRTTFLVDVGSGDSVDWPKLGISKGKLLETVSGVGLGDNEMRGITGLGKLRLGKFEFDEIPVHCCGGNELGNHLIGGDLLKRFTVTLDFQHQRMMLVPNDSISKAFAFDCSGLILREERDPKLFRIKTVISGTPAAEAELKTAELIEQVNGVAAAGWSLENLENALEEPGQTFEMVVSDASGKKKTVKFVTRKIL
jgi:predicted aspartyl protease